jgi:hypothetical protein
MNAPLKVGILLDAFSAELWQQRMLERVVRGSYAKIVLLVLNQDGAQKPATASALWRKRGKIGHYLLLKLDRWLFRPDPDPFARCDLSDLLRDIPIVRVRPLKQGFVDRFDASDVQEIRRHQVDVLIRMGFRILKGDILQAARYGVWSFHHGDNRVNRGAPPGFWEAVRSWGETGSILQVITEELDGGHVLQRSWSLTNQLSISKNRSKLYWKTLRFLPRKLEELQRIGPERFFSGDQRELSLYAGPLYTTPSNAQAAALALKQLGKVAQRALTRAFLREQWVLMYRFQSAPATSFWRFATLLPPRDRFWADPFVLRREDGFYVFFEDLPFRTNKGHISVCKLGEDGRAGVPIKVLERPYHLSYPFLLEDNGRLFMIPETGDNRTIELYECVDFPERWQHRVNLMENVDAVDATVIHHNGKWWLFCAMAEEPGAPVEDELFLFYSDDLFEPRWTPHPLNPIVSDVKRARPAGRIFAHGGQLYRPSQNSFLRYGYGLNLNRIIALSETDYQETTVSAVVPAWDKSIKGVHTFNFCPGLTVIDALRVRPRLLG